MSDVWRERLAVATAFVVTFLILGLGGLLWVTTLDDDQKGVAAALVALVSAVLAAFCGSLMLDTEIVRETCPAYDRRGRRVDIVIEREVRRRRQRP